MIQELLFAMTLAGADTGNVKLPIHSTARVVERDTSVLSPPDRWFGEDKLKHFALSYMITVGGYSSARFVAGHNESIMIGAGIGLAAGIAKEIYDRKSSGTPSLRDLLWDAAGIATGVIIAAHTR